ncbi:hypothetical protein L1994_01205 [Methanomicrobium antiquum]|uniref:Uncharacterized protein n=1 Tax=Methanomicrobium antiquum TaxID=487686 RepID=A0AAF0FV83_9EURY|nr:hypothetical protein [Methanomicrobium antiquum]MDD3977085.1 hypothetical protein [Methanomicrobium sp.]WFN37043.1 hypothetical protein L1994_01205 [Methanomicrobium antiquum]
MNSKSDMTLEEIFAEEGITNEIYCEKAFEIAEKYGLKKLDITRHCNKNNVKIRKCQLGCFK